MEKTGVDKQFEDKKHKVVIKEKAILLKSQKNKPHLFLRWMRQSRFHGDERTPHIVSRTIFLPSLLP